MAPGRALLPAALLALALGPGPAAALPCIADCPPGTFLASEDCGLWGARADCRPCPAGTFSSTAGRGLCRMCRQCQGLLQYLKNCSSTSDAECTCRKGYRCGDESCTFCSRVCGVGQERTRNGCQTCRYGTFNDQPGGSCKNWTTCSGNQVLEPGTPAKDVICKHASVNPTLVTTLPTTSLEIPFSITVPGKKDVQTDMMRISLAVAGVSCIMFLLPLCICFSVWQKKKLSTVFKKMHTLEQSVQEDDACSCRFPEEEQGEYQDPDKSTESRDLLVN